MSAAAAPEAENFQHFRILRREDGSLWQLGEGGMGATYKALDTELKRLVALKLIRAEFLDKDTSAHDRFVREAQSAASLRHRHVATVYHLGKDAETYFYAMEFVDGETLEERVKRLGPLPVEKVLALALQASRALIAAHKVGLVHRDLKPANLMLVDEADEDDVLKVIDFGLAKSVSPDATGYRVTRTGLSAGFSPVYASPEQCQYLDADIRSDLYSLGVTLWFVLAGEPPFLPTAKKRTEEQIFELQSKHVMAEPPLEKLAAAGVPAPVRELLARMLAKDPAARPQTPADLRKVIETCQQAVREAASTPALPPPAPAYSFSLEELLRQRGSLDWKDMVPLLTPLAGFADDLAASGAAALVSFTPRHLRAVFPSFHPSSSGGDRRLLPEFLHPAEWIQRWPDCTLMVRSATADTSRVPAIGKAFDVTQPPALQHFRDAPQALDALVYELLDGQPPPSTGSSANFIKPLPALNEVGNDTLRRALGGPDHGFGSAGEFGAALERAASRRAASSSAAPPPQSPPPLPPAAQIPAPPPLPSSPAPPASPPIVAAAADNEGKRRPFLAVTVLVAVLLLAGGGGLAAWLAAQQPKASPQQRDSTPTPTPIINPAPSPLPTIPTSTPTLAPTPPPPTPTSAPTPVPVPTPQQSDQANRLLEEALSAYKAHDYQQTIEKCTAALALAPNLPLAYSRRGDAFYQLEQKDRALEDYRQAIKLDPSHAPAYNGRGLVYYYNQGKPEQALADFNQAIELDPRYAPSTTGATFTSPKAGPSRRWPTTTKRSNSTRSLWPPSTTGAPFTPTKASLSRRWPTSAKPSNSTRSIRPPTLVGAAFTITKVSSSRRWPTSTRPSNSTQDMRSLTTNGAGFTPTKTNGSRRWPTTTRP